MAGSQGLSYYRDIHRWSFNMEVFFLKERFRDLIDIAKADHTIIQDRTIYEGVHVFMENNREMGNLSERDYETYMELFEQMMSVVKLPDLMIYLRASVPHLVSNIQKRGRDYEQAIQLEYLQNLNTLPATLPVSSTRSTQPSLDSFNFLIFKFLNFLILNFKISCTSQ